MLEGERELSGLERLGENIRLKVLAFLGEEEVVSFLARRKFIAAGRPPWRVVVQTAKAWTVGAETRHEIRAGCEGMAWRRRPKELGKISEER